MPIPEWFALRVRPKHERVLLERQGFGGYLPVQTIQRRWSDRVKKMDAPLFPGYTFGRFERRDRLVGFGKQDVPVDDAEVQAARALVASGRAPSAGPFLRIGQSVTITGGVLAGLRCVVRSDNGSSRVEALDRLLAISVNRDILYPEKSLTLHGCH